MNDYIEDYGELVILSIMVSAGIVFFQKMVEMVTNIF